VKCRKGGLLRHSNVPGQQLVVSLTNISKDLVTNMDNLEVTQVVLVSRDHKLSSIQSSNSACSVSRGDMTNISLKAEKVETIEPKWLDMDRLKHLPANVSIPGGRLHFSSVTGGATNVHPPHLPPFIDFIKHQFTHNLGKRGNPPILGNELCIILWRSNSIMGQTVVSIEEADEGFEEDKLVVNGVSEETEVEEFVPFYPLNINAKVKSEVMHDFTTISHCCIKVEVEMSCNADIGVLVQYTVNEQIKGARIIGNTDGLVWIESGKYIKIEMGVIISRPGFFHLKSFKFRAKSMDICDKSVYNNSEEVFLPLDICFTVHQA